MSLPMVMDRTTPWTEVIRYAEVTSTQTLARDHARRGAPEGTAVVAGHQRDGRGRRGRRWLDVPNTSLLVSFVLRPEPRWARSAWLTLLGGIATARTLRDLYSVDARLKWPNDVHLDGAKVAGVLTEIYPDGDGAVCLVGVGINVLQSEADFGPELRDEATSLRLATGRGDAPLTLLEPLRARLREEYETLLRNNLRELRSRWQELDTTLGRTVVVETPQGELRGRADSIDDLGALTIENGEGEPQRVVVGDVSVRFDG